MDKAKKLERNAQKELCEIIEDLVHIIAAEANDIEIERKLTRQMEDSLANLAKEVELKIRAKQIDKLKRKALTILKKSTNKLLLGTISDYYEN